MNFKVSVWANTAEWWRWARASIYSQTANLLKCVLLIWEGFPNGSTGKEFTCNAGDTGDACSILGWEDPLEKGGNGNPFQYSCLKNPMDREAWQATVYGVAKSRTRPSNFTFFLSSSALYTVSCHSHRDLGQGHYTGLHYTGHYSCASPQGNLHKPW